MRILLFLFFLISALFIFLASFILKTSWAKRAFRIYGALFLVSSFIIAAQTLYTYKSSVLAFLNMNTTSIGEFQTTTYHQPLISGYGIKGKIILDAPQINQLPELPRGCEVTALAMLLAYNDITVDKMVLAENISKNPAKYHENNGDIYFGDPNEGFVGDMYSFSTPGLGVYHSPIATLARTYSDDIVIDLTGEGFSSIIEQLNNKQPVWVIINTAYKRLPQSAFTTWQTDNGPINITMKEHSVLITGYDHEYIYFNDPLNRQSKASINSFKNAWKQMGEQAISIMKEN